MGSKHRPSSATMKTCHFTAYLWAATLLVLVVSCIPLQQVDDERTMCARNLTALRLSVTQYRDDHDGLFPTSLEVALTNIAVENVSLVSCPAIRKKPPQSTEMNSLGYIYVNWPERGIIQPPGDFPLIYDSDLDRHNGGVNVVCIDGSLRWDPSANWLTAFATQYPKARLPLPKTGPRPSGRR